MRGFAVLLLVMTLGTSGHPLTVGQNPPAVQADEAKFSPEEEQEARALVARFREQLRVTNDFGPIVDELFVGDFQERLWQAPSSSIPWLFLDKVLVGDSDPARLRRFYIASMNFYGLFYRLSEAIEALKEQPGGSEEEVKVKDILSPEVINALLSDPTIAELARELKGEDENNRARESDDVDETGIIKTLRQLDGVSSTLEKANELMRKRLASLPAGPPASSVVVDETKGRQESRELFATSLGEDKYGYPQGTRVIHADVLGFCLTLIRIDGRLKIMSVVLYVD